MGLYPLPRPAHHTHRGPRVLPGPVLQQDLVALPGRRPPSLRRKRAHVPLDSQAPSYGDSMGRRLQRHRGACQPRWPKAGPIGASGLSAVSGDRVDLTARTAAALTLAQRGRGVWPGQGGGQQVAQAPPSHSASTLGDSTRSGLPQEVGCRCPRHPDSHLQVTGWRGKPIPRGLATAGCSCGSRGSLSAGSTRVARGPATERGLRVTVHVESSCMCPRASRRHLENTCVK